MIVSIWAANYEHITRAFTKSRRMALFEGGVVHWGLALAGVPDDHTTFEKGQELKIWDVTISEEEKKRLGVVSSADREQ